MRTWIVSGIVLEDSWTAFNFVGELEKLAGERMRSGEEGNRDERGKAASRAHDVVRRTREKQDARVTRKLVAGILYHEL